MPSFIGLLPASKIITPPAVIRPAEKASEVSPPPLQLRFRVRFALSAGKNTVHISNKSENSEVHPYDFYCGAWMGGSNPHMDFQMLQARADGTGEAAMCVPLMSDDVDVLKLGMYVRDPSTCMMRHVVSGFQSLKWLEECMAAGCDCDKTERSMLIKDNYTQNQALLRFCNDSTDLAALNMLLPHLKASVLHQNAEINKSVTALSFGLHDFLEQVSNVSNVNGGSNFVNSMCFTECMGCAINYPLLDMTYTSGRHVAPLSMLAYMALATAHYVGLAPEVLMRLDDARFVNDYIVPLCTSFTVCPHTAMYSGDETIGLQGKLDLGTEDFAMVMSHHYYQDVLAAYVDAYGDAKRRSMSTEELVAHIATLRARKDKSASDGRFLISDDCETLSGLIKSVESSVLRYHLLSVDTHAQKQTQTQTQKLQQALVGSSSDPGAGDEAHDLILAHMMWEETRALPSLSAVPMQDFVSCARLLGRYGRLRQNCATGKAPCSQMGLSVVSAKGPSFSLVNRELNGHACVISQTIGADGNAKYSIAEGTSKLLMRDLPKGCPKDVTLPLTTGPRKFSTTEALSIVAINMADYTKTFGKSRVGEVIPRTYEGTDPYNSCPFYMAGFFVGLEMNKCTPGVVPMEERGSTTVAPLLKEDGVQGLTLKPCDSEAVAAVPPKVMFGAPLVSLSSEKVRAVPIDLGKIFGVDEATNLLASIRQRNDETYPPMVPKSKLDMLMSTWAPLEPLSGLSAAPLLMDPERTWLSCCSESFKNADELRAVLEYKARLATEFNAIQAKDPKDDGVRMVVRGQMLSVVCQFRIPLPQGDVWDLSCARSAQLALSAVPRIATTPSAELTKVGVRFSALSEY